MTIHKDDVVLYITNDCEPYEWTEESLKRFEKFVETWQKHGPFHVLLSGGIPNKNHKTIGQAIKEKMVADCRGIEKYFIEPMDITSADTAIQVFWCTNIFKRYCERHPNQRPRLFVISNYWHLVRLAILFANHGLRIQKIVSPMSGNRKFRFKRFLNELVLSLISIVDKNYTLKFFQKERQRRKFKARERDLSEIPKEGGN